LSVSQARLYTEARTEGTTAFLTTEKDQVRLGKLSASFPDCVPLKTASLRIEIDNEDEAIDWLVGQVIRSTKAE
jgi:tetraacyldisaccharide-1-P 4'-kinase